MRIALAAALAAIATGAAAQPYAITSSDPLVIEKLLGTGSTPETVAYLENTGTDNGIDYHGRTNATRAGFNFTCSSSGGQGWTGLVYRDDDVTYRAAIDAGQLGNPEFAEADWNSIEVYDGTIEPMPGTTGYDPACASTGAPGAVLAADPEVPLSYLLKQQQIGFAREFVWFARDLISGGVGTHIESDHWTKDNMVLTVGGPLHLTFRHLGWDPQHTDEEFGPRKLLDTTDKTYQGAGFLAALRDSTEGVDYKQTQTVTVEHHREVTMDRETHIDIGAEAGVTIGGDSVGVSVETKLTTEFGTRVDNSQTDGESRSRETSKEINYLFPAGRDTLLTIVTRTVSTEQWLKIDGVSDMGFSVRWPVSLTWANSQDHPPRANLVGGGNPLGLKTTGRGDSQMYSMTFANWDEFETMMEGFNTNFPAMAGWQFARGDIIDGEQIGPHIARIRAPSLRAVVFSGIQREDEDGVLTVDIQDVTGQDLGGIQTQYNLPDDRTADPNGRIAAAVAALQDGTDTVTLEQAMVAAGTGDVGLFTHSIGRAVPGIPPFDPDLPADVWEAVEVAVSQHVRWHANPFTVHALPGGRERITRGHELSDPVVYEDPSDWTPPAG